MDNDAIDRSLERPLVEEQEKAEIETRASMARARLSAGDRSVTMFEAWGDPYNRINAIKDVRRATGLPLVKAKALVEAYVWDRARTIEASIEYSRGELAQHLDLKPSMSTKDWLEIRETIEAESDLEAYRCKKAELYLYLAGRSSRYVNICKRGEALLERPREDDE
jgi:hypothetical protein